ncbi:MAG TPA: glucosaminidase domain-containing protein [Flavisolibacter sp.]
MKKLHLLLLAFSVLPGSLIFAQSSQTIRNYIETYKDIAIEEELRTGVPASITLAQGIHETGAGTSKLVLASNNHFGIKCKSDWKGASVSHDDDARGECFRKYDDPIQSYRDHSDFLKHRAHYAFLFRLDPTDYEAWAYGLKKAGYATNPKYPQILIKLIRDYNLQEYTLLAREHRATRGSDARWISNTSTLQTESSNDAHVQPAVSMASYPSGVFTINETKVVVITKGTSFLKIADENNVSLKRLFDFNEIPEADIADRDQLLFLQRKRKTGSSEFHTVVAGETLHDIAQAEGIRLEALLELNLLEPGMRPATGEKLYLQHQAPVKPALAGTRPAVTATPAVVEEVEPAALYHTVQSKETLYAIAKKYAVTIDELMNWNGLKTTDLKTGQQLRILKKG